MVEIFGEQGGTSRFDRCGKDGRVPITDLVAAAEAQGVTDHLRAHLNRRAGGQQFDCFLEDGFVDAEVLSAKAGCDEFLQDLSGDEVVGFKNEFLGDGVFGMVLRSLGRCIEKKVGIKKTMQAGG